MANGQAVTTTQSKPAATWTPNPDDPITHIQIGDDHFHIHTDDLPEAQRRTPGLKVVKVVRQDPMVSAFQSMAQQDSPDSQPASRPSPSGDPMLDAFKALKDNPDDDPAKRPGAYQQTKGGAIRNINEDAANPFSDTTTSVISSTGAMMKRPDETDSQFMARAIQAGRNLTPAQIAAETASNKRLAAPTAGIALAAGPAMLSLESAAGSVFDYAAEKLGMSAAEDMGLREWVEQMGQKMPTVLDKVTGAAKTALQWMKANPIKTYFIYKTARELGLPLGKLLHLASSGE